MTDLPFNFSDGQELPASALNQMLTARTGDIKPIDNTTREYTDNAGALGFSTYRYTNAHMDNLDTIIGALQSKQAFVSNGTFTVPTGVKQIYIEAVGGGGGSAGAKGGGVNVNGGSASQAFTFMVDVETLAVATIDIVLGAGGTAGAATPTAGGNGGSTVLTFKNAATATVKTTTVTGGLGSETTTIGIDTVKGRGKDSIFAEGGACAITEGAGVAGTLGSGGGSGRDHNNSGDVGSAGGAGKVIIYY